VEKQIVVFDFDGVVCDSTDECMVTSWNAWERWNHRSGYRTAVNEFTPDERADFRRLRPFVRGAGEYYVLRKCLNEQCLVQGYADYEHHRQKSGEYFEAFKQIFYHERERLRDDDLNAWIKLHPVWPEVIGVMKKLNERGRVYIATLKDGESVKLILESEGLTLHADHLLDQSQISSKLDALEKIMGLEKCGKQEIIFLDDNATHLIEPVLEGYTCYMTTWGDTPDDYHHLAARNNIPGLTLDMLKATLDCAAQGLS